MHFSLSLRFAIVLIVGLAFVATSCRNEDNSTPDIEQQDRIIATVTSTDDPTVFTVSWFPAPCERFDDVVVTNDEDYANLRVRVTVDTANCPESSISETVVDIGEPLDGRRIWDKAFNNTVAIDAS